MKNKSLLFLAKRFLRGQDSKFIGKEHLLTIAGIALGVLALLSVSSVMNGFREDMQMRIIGTLSEIRITGLDGIQVGDYREVIKEIHALGYKAAPVIRTELLLKKANIIEPTMSFGIDYPLQAEVSAVLKPYIWNDKSNSRQGLTAGEVDPESFKEGGIILGSGLAYRLNANPGDIIQIVSPMFTEPTAFGLLPKIRSVKVLAIFAAGMPEYDSMYSYIPFEMASYFQGGYGFADYIELKTGSLKHAKRTAIQLAKRFPRHSVQDWSSFDPSLYNAIRFEKMMMFVIMLLMYIIASFNLTGNMLKTIAQKKRELGLLKAIGYKEEDLRLLFLLKSFILSSLGVAIGLGLAIVLLNIQKHFQIIRISLSLGDYIALPVSFELWDFVMVVSAAYLLSIISILFPLRQLKGINTIELIRQNA